MPALSARDLLRSFQPGVGQLLEVEEVHVRVNDRACVQLVMVGRVVVVVVSGVALRVRQVQVSQPPDGSRHVLVRHDGGGERRGEQRQTAAAGAADEFGRVRGGSDSEELRLELSDLSERICGAVTERLRVLCCAVLG
jgi:hypothetical protein